MGLSALHKTSLRIALHLIQSTSITTEYISLLCIAPHPIGQNPLTSAIPPTDPEVIEDIAKAIVDLVFRSNSHFHAG
jgi:hypothetical protein